MQTGLVLSTKMVDPGFRVEFWRELARPIFDLTSADGAKDQLDASLHSHRLGELTLASVYFSEQLVTIRDRQTIVSSGLDHYVVHVMVEGALAADFDGQSVSIRPGDIWLFDLARPFCSDAEPSSRIMLTIPRPSIDRANGGKSAHGLVLPAASPLTGLLRRYLVDLHEKAGCLGANDLRAMEVITVDFIASVISRQREGSSRQTSSVDRIRQHMLDFIDGHIGDPKLGPELLMRHFQMSRAHLYRFFVEAGGVAAVIRNRRLDAAYRMLKSPSFGGSSITDIAFELGFANSAHFTRAFSSRFGLPPSRARRDDFPLDGGMGTARLQAHLEAQMRNWT